MGRILLALIGAAFAVSFAMRSSWTTKAKIAVAACAVIVLLGVTAWPERQELLGLWITPPTPAPVKTNAPSKDAQQALANSILQFYRDANPASDPKDIVLVVNDTLTQMGIPPTYYYREPPQKSALFEMKHFYNTKVEGNKVYTRNPQAPAFQMEDFHNSPVTNNQVLPSRQSGKH